MLTNEQKRLREKLGRLMARRALLPEVERSAINAEIEVAAGQLARLVAIACRAVERPVPDYTDEWIETPREAGEPEIVHWPPDVA
jgi:hypothetical protein